MSDIVKSLRRWTDRDGETTPLGKDAADEIERLRAALTKTQIGVNHIATYRTDKWPGYGTDHEVALERLGAGREYDMWCCWNAAMTARDELAQPLI